MGGTHPPTGEGAVIWNGHSEGTVGPDMDQFLFTILENSRDAVWVVDLATNLVIACNQMVFEVLDIADESLILGKSCQSYLEKSFSEKEAAEITKSLTENNKWEGTCSFVSPSGRQFPAELLVTTFVAGESTFAVTRIVDRSSDLEAEDALQHSQIKLDIAEQALGLGIWEYKPGSEEMVWSEKMYSFFGLDLQDEITYDRFINLVHPSQVETLQSHFDQAIKSGEAFEIELRFKQSDDSYCWGFVVGNPMHENGKLVKLVGAVIDISQQKSFEDSLRDREERLSLILQNIDESVYNISISEDGTRRIEYVSPQIQRIFGFSAKEYTEASARGFLEHYHPEDIDVIRQTSDQLRLTRTSVAAIYRFRPKNATHYVWLEEKVFPKYDVDGRHIANFGILRNVNERVQAELLLKKSEEQFRNMFRNAPIGMAITSMDGFFVNVNQAYCKLLGYQEHELVNNLTFADLSHPDDVSEDVLLREKLLAGQIEHFSVEKRFLRKDGTVLQILLKESLERDELDKPLQFIAQVVDITPRVAAEAQLAASEQRYRDLFARNLAGVFQTINGKLQDCNVAFARIFGFEGLDDLATRDANELFYDPSHRTDYVQDLKSKGSLTNYELLAKRRDGSPIWVLVNVSYTRDEAADVEVIEGTLIDITESKNIRNLLSGIAQAAGFLFTNSDFYAGLSDAFGLIGRATSVDRAYLYGVNDVGEAELRQEWCRETVQPTSENEMRKRFSLKAYKRMGQTLQNREIFTGFARNMRGRNYEFMRSGNVISIILIPIFVNDQFWGFFGFDDCHSERFWSEYEQSTLLALAGNIGNNITNLDYKRHLEESEERFRLLSEATIEGILFTHAGRILDANDQFARLHGYDSRNEVIGMMISDFVLKEDLDKVDSIVKDGSEEKYEVRSRKKDGTIMTLESKGQYIPIDSLEVRVSVVYDITDRKQNEFELQRSRESFSNLVNFSPDGILIHVDGVVQFANPTAIRLLGFKEEKELLSQSMTSFFEPAYRKTIERRIAQLKKGDRKLNLAEVKAARSDGELIELGIQSVHTTYDGKSAVQVILHDLTSQKKLAAEQLRAEVAEEANRQLAIEIRDHKLTQRKLQAAQKFTRNIIDSSLDMIMATNTKSEITEFNHAAITQFGFLFDEVKGQHPRMLYASSGDLDKVQRALSEHGEFSGEILNRRKNGEEFTTYLAASILRDEDGVVQGAMGVSRDITEAKRSQQKIQEQAAKIRSIFESSSHLIWSVDRNKNLTSFNQNFAESVLEIYGNEPQLNTPIVINDARSTRDYNRLWDRKYNACLSGQPQHFETSTLNESGEERWQEIFLHPIYGSNDEVIEVSGIGHDVTYKKQAERKMEEQSAKIRSIFESTSHMMIWTLDKNFRITSFNRNFANTMRKMMGAEVELGQNFLDMLGPFVEDERFELMSKIYKSAIRGKSQLFEGPINDTEGGTVWIETFLNPIFLDMGKIREISCLAHEITDKKLAERQIKQSLKEKEVLLKEVHHRVKNNLQVISSILNLQSSYVKDSNTLDILKESQNRIKSMSFIHESLYQTKNFSSIDFSDYILNLSKNLVHSYRVYNDLVDLKLDINKVFLNLDQAIPCGLIVNELVSNSLKYAFPGETGGEIRIGLSQKDQKIFMKVEDTGIGLPEDFDYRNTDSLGLQLVATLVEQLDGEMELDSSEGTKYLITFDQLT